jgi:hypothetical protein
MKTIIHLALVMLALAVSGCSILGAKQAPTPTFAPTSPPALPPAPTQTLAPPTATPLPSPTPFTPFDAATWVGKVNVRSNPGYLFDVITNVDTGTKFLVLGKSPGGEWIYVQVTPDSKGWVFARLLKSDQDMQLAPVVQPEDVQVIKGRVVDERGEPISGLQFSLIQGAGDTALRNDAITNASGEFFSFFPTKAAGIWAVSYAGITCTSNMMDENCKCKNGICGMVSPFAVNVTLPQTDLLSFSWK